MDAHISRKTTLHHRQRLTQLITSLFLFGFSWSITGQDARVTLTWQPSPSTNASGYTLRYGTSHNYDSVLFAGNNTSATITNLEPGSLYFFAVTVTDNEGLESDPSNEVTYKAPGSPNAPPTLEPLPDLTIPINSGPHIVPLVGITAGAATENQTLTIQAASSDPGTIPNPRVVFDPQQDSGALTLQPASNAYGKVTITVTVNDGQSRSNTITRSFRVQIGTPVFSTFFLEAESGVVSSPMRKSVNPQALSSVYVATAQSSSGSVSYQLNIPQPGDYLLWCRILSVDDGTDSFFVSVDGGGDDIFDTAMEQHSSSWKWVPLNGRFLGTNRVLSLTRGQHTIRFRGRESDTRLDALYISNNPRFVPVELRIDPVESPAPGVKLSFRSHLGCTYGIEASQDLKVWTPIYNSGTVTVERDVAVVEAAPETGKRFYRLMTQY